MGISIVNIDNRPVTLDVKGLLVDVVEGGGGTRPAEDPPGIFGLHIHAAVAHREPEVIMPVSAMQGYALACENTGPGNSGQDNVGQTAGFGTHAP